MPSRSSRSSSNPSNFQPGSLGWDSAYFPSSGAPCSSQLQSPLHPTAYYRPQPPPAPRMRSVPLPDVNAPRIRQALHPSTDNFPLDLTANLDRAHLARTLPNCLIPAHTTIRVRPTSGGRAFLHFDSGDRPASAVAVIRRLQALLVAPLSLELYQDLAHDVQQAVASYFVAGPVIDGGRLWQDFMSGYQHPQGPMGVVLLQGHFHLWGLRQDHNLRWVVDIDVPPRQIPHAPRVQYSY
ncbi:hypothetical protein C8R43DRAFT_967118 [Mycena crocata]|nr:hypothetical protein C8R43DRAFT_967118 [Mycena crocata]